MILNLVVTNVYVYLSKEKKVYVEGVGEKLWSYMVELEGGEKKEKKKDLAYYKVASYLIGKWIFK